MSAPRCDGPAPSLLLMGCSRRKTPGLAEGRAWDLYDGRLFQVLKKALRAHPGWDAEVAVLIVSARYGVIPAGRVIATYDQRLAGAPGEARGARFAGSLRRAIGGRRFRAVHVNLGRAYLSALPDLAAVFAPAAVDYSAGGIGVRNARTRRWVLEQLGDAAGRDQRWNGSATVEPSRISK